ncbi:hypothetical protein RZ70_08950 [Apilactobacillus kunkeei]|uniref:Lreu_0056 family protein n=1 Tax=Apilactobacillus kunkeei TaxID=148814 RepID=UPI0006C112AD|nr:hypothetical protein [Apilactobacillus kunkeei]KOY75533.1 hypothetical protein RZ70_08950 [Apilactobacillus kunkeei]
MIKKTIYIIGLASIISLMLVGCGKSKAAHQSDKPYGAGQTSKKVSSKSNSSISANSDSSSNDSNSSSSASSLNLDDKTYGVLAFEYDHDIQAKGFGHKENHDQYDNYTSVKKPNVHEQGAIGGWFFVDKRSKYEAKNHLQFDKLTFNGDGTVDLMFNVEPNSVYVQFRDMSQAGDKAMVDIPTVKKTISKDYLINTYYKTAEQRKHVDNYAKSILSEEVYDKHNQELDDTYNDD